jgi:hypothetical protein
MAGQLDGLLRSLGEQLAGKGLSEQERSWQRFLDTDREAEQLAEHLEARHSEILRMDPVPAEWFPDWDEEARGSLWVGAGDLEIMDGCSELRRRWREFDPVVCPPDPVEGYARGEVDDVSYMLFLLRLPEPSGAQRAPTVADYLAEVRTSSEECRAPD